MLVTLRGQQRINRDFCQDKKKTRLYSRNTLRPLKQRGGGGGGSCSLALEFSKEASIGEATVHETDESVLYYEELLEKWGTRTKICKKWKQI